MVIPRDLIREPVPVAAAVLLRFSGDLRDYWDKLYMRLRKHGLDPMGVW